MLDLIDSIWDHDKDDLNPMLTLIERKNQAELRIKETPAN
jgi:hypothetical protein